MTDPFKNQRYSSSPYGGSSSMQANEFGGTGSSLMSSPARGNNEYSGYYRAPPPPGATHGFDPMMSESVNSVMMMPKRDFYQAYIHANQDTIKQLKSNIELLFKGAKIFSNFAFYPLQALRWQCQINSESSKFHLTPITLLPVFYNLNYHGFMTLWKGCFSMAAYDGIKVVLESVLGELTSFEKNIEDANKGNKIYGHFLLKTISNILTTPIYSAVIYESVQSGISNENLGIVDLLRETWNRVTGYRYNYRTRLIPFWSLILPTTAYFVGFHLVSTGLRKFLRKTVLILKQVFTDKKRIVEEVEVEVVEKPYTEILVELASQVGAMLAMYPLETMLNRLIVQGTRTIIDNTDTGYGVVPINTRYDGLIDCAQSIVQTEGVMGFYKGVGTLLFQAALQYMVLNMAKTVATRIYESEWTVRSDMNAIKNLMGSSSSSNPN